MLKALKASRLKKEQGQVIVFFANLLPVILTIGSVVVSAGNWYVLRTTPSDAGGCRGTCRRPQVTGCAQDLIATN